MGMFDTVRFKAGLPDGSPCGGDTEFETKGLDCQMDEYEVAADRRLYKVASYPPEGWRECDPVPVDFGGELRLFGHAPSGRLVLYRARFAGGVLASVTDETPPKGGN